MYKQGNINTRKNEIEMISMIVWMCDDMCILSEAIW